MVIPLCHIKITNPKSKEFIPDVIPGFIAYCFLMNVTHFVSGWCLCIVPIRIFLFSFLSFVHSCLPTYLLPFCLTVPIYPSLWLDLLVNPLAFVILVASFTFPSGLPSRRLRTLKSDIPIVLNQITKLQKYS